MCIWYRTQRSRGEMKETFLSDVAKKNQHSDLYNLKHEHGAVVYLFNLRIILFPFLMLQHLDQPSVFILTHYTR